MSSTRIIMIGGKRIVVNNVPDAVSNAQLKVYAKIRLYQIGAIKSIIGNQAS